ncbi:ATP-binding cassette domain-containing protein [Echinicola rosea]|uniref:Molybdenum ABC transporter ATP-binding protein n=1 Tax=Echinicola rosea TaxID=1807691 RepID=A0ABQ1UJV5_9BACT|nr:ATP-binding cassette domain-containing protein [Echinicola rosea]GGF19665.1 molybdenum ABC transporter ATP-binding protein [Echinicola rosea]
MTQDIFLSIDDAKVKYLDRTIFQQLDFSMSTGEHWAILSASGSEKTAFLDTILGKTILSAGRVTRDFAVDYQLEMTAAGKINSFRDLIAVVSQKYTFTNKSNLQNFYYQQRFNSSESEEAATVREELLGVEAKQSGPWNVDNVMELLELEELKEKSLIKLSNGESRRLAIACALLRNPLLFLMDQPMTGLDVAMRAHFGKVLKAITASGIQVIMTTSPDEIPEAITHVAILDGGKVTDVAKREDFQQVDLVNHAALSQFDHMKLDELIQQKPVVKFETLIQMNHVHIQYNGKVILDDVSWQVKQGDCWVLRGHNGAGKSTLLSLINGENPQAYANDLVLFDRKRGTGETIWDIKRPIGFVSPELARYFPANQTCLKVVLSGLFDTIGLFKKVTAEQEKQAMDWLRLFRIEHVAQMRLTQIPLENQRFCLLARAMIKSPALLVLDEAAQGMDDEQRLLFRETVAHIGSHPDVSMIYVSHYDQDIPKVVDHELVLDEGKVVKNV